MTGKRPRLIDLIALRVPLGVRVDTVLWLLILPYHALSGWPSESTALRFFLEIFVLAILREAAQRLWVKRATSASELLWGFLFSLTVFAILGVGVRFVGVGIAWLLVAIYAVLMLVLNEPRSQESEQISDPQWDSARLRVGLTQVDLWQTSSARHLIFSVGGRQPAVVLGQNFFLQDRPVRDFLFFHELGHLSLGHFRHLGYYIESELRLRLEVEAARFAINQTGDRDAAQRFLAAYAEHPLESGDANHAGRRVPASRRLDLLRSTAHLTSAIERN